MRIRGEQDYALLLEQQAFMAMLQSENVAAYDKKSQSGLQKMQEEA